MTSISERREQAILQIQNLKKDYSQYQQLIQQIKTEADAKINEYQNLQNKIVLMIEKLSGKIEVYNEEEPPKSAEVTPITKKSSANKPDAS